MPNGLEQWFDLHESCFYQTSEVDQELVTRVNLTNVLDEGLRIGEIGRRMNSKVKSVKKGMYQK
jgi:hypothetical protein